MKNIYRMAATIVIGDIHGGFKALRQVMEKIGRLDDCRFIFLGDYIDGWSESFEVIDYLLDFGNTYDCIFLRGNHDPIAADWLKRNEADQIWLKHGGQATCDSYAGSSPEDRARHLAFFESLKDFHEDDKGRLFIHAGYTSVKGPHHEGHVSTLIWDRSLWELALALDPKIPADSKRFPARLSLYKEIFIGHTPVTHLGETVPVKASIIWNVDTGAAARGKLTAMDIDTKVYWQSDKLKELYPLEKERH